MKRWFLGVLGLALLCGFSTGCRQQVFLSKECLDQAHAALPAHLETDLSIGVTPMTPPIHSPPTADDADRPAWEMTLQEAVAICLENGTASSRAGTGRGEVDDNLVAFQGGSLNGQVDRVRVLALNPAISASNIEAALSRFDAMWVSSMNWSATDNLLQGLTGFQNGSTAQLGSSIVKPLPTGGFSAVSFTTNYQDLNSPPNGFLNPLYTTRATVGFEQPLWRDYGTEINYLQSRTPTYQGTGGITNAANAVNGRQSLAQTEGILISRVRFDQQRAEFERLMQALILNTEVAYWKLYQAYGNLYSFEEVMRIAHKSWMINHAKFIAGTIGPKDYYPVRGQYEEFRGERLNALANVIERERQLRGILGLPIEDGKRIVPVTPPVLAPFTPDWNSALDMAVMQRPELVIAREHLRVSQYNVVVQKNLLKPDLRFVTNYSAVGFGNRLDSNGTFTDQQGITHTSNALRSLAQTNFSEWNIGLTMTVPLGFRLENANVRSARLQLYQAYYILKDQEERAQRVLANQYQEISKWYRLIEARRAERKAYADSVEARFREFAAGKTTIADFLLEAQRRLATAQVKEYEAISEYNNALTRFEWAKGNSLQYNNIFISEGPLPYCAQVRAVEHERERTKSFILRERPSAIASPGRMIGHVPPGPDASAPLVSAAPVSPAPFSTGVIAPVGPEIAPFKRIPVETIPAPGKKEPTTGSLDFRSVPTAPVSTPDVSFGNRVPTLPTVVSTPTTMSPPAFNNLQTLPISNQVPAFNNTAPTPLPPLNSSSMVAPTTISNPMVQPTSSVPLIVNATTPALPTSVPLSFAPATPPTSVPPVPTATSSPFFPRSTP